MEFSGSFIILNLVLHDLNNNLCKIIAKREKININILVYYQSPEGSVLIIIIIFYLLC
jgi:hypothetical protein